MPSAQPLNGQVLGHFLAGMVGKEMAFSYEWFQRSDSARDVEGKPVAMLIACSDCRRQYKVEGLAPGAHIHCYCGGTATVPKEEPHDARMVHCSSCGANVEEGATSCGYCQSAIVLADHKLGHACPECYARLPLDAAYCNECGIPINAEEIETAPVSESCPRCEGVLVQRKTAAATLTECTTCGGMWLPESSFERFVEKRDDTSLGSFLSAAAASGPQALEAQGTDTHRYIPCPQCGELMNRKNFAGCSGVVIDWCKGHGYWFDANELPQIAAFIGSGGMDKARERDLRAAQRKLDRVQWQTQQANRSMHSGGGHSTTTFSFSDSEPEIDFFGGLVSLVRRLFSK